MARFSSGESGSVMSWLSHSSGVNRVMNLFGS